ncbi:zyg eleven-related protein 1 [Ditylenchus destructor]|nr:zyg eleven-related protein 1 [Ditylenchus destructor]
MLAKDKPPRAPSLLELSANVVARNNCHLLYEKCSQDPSSSSPAANFSLRYARNPVVELPMAVADVVVKHVCKNLRNESASTDLVAENLRPFLDGERQPLGRLDLSGLNITDRTLASLLAAQQSTLTSLDLSNILLTSLVTYFTDIRSEEVYGILTDLKVQFLKLNTLKVTNCDLLRIPRFRVRRTHESNVLPAFALDHSWFDLDTDWDQEIAKGTVISVILQSPNIQHLYLQQGLLNNIKDETADEFLFRIFKTLKRLRTLDLSEWHFPNHLHVLENAPNLTTLILYDVQNLESCIPMISSLKNLKCVDLSQSERVTGQYSKPVTCLHTLVTKLPNLECLDISGTNLTSNISDDDRPYEICCDHGEDQIILAMEAYLSREKMMKAVLDKSCQWYRYETDLNRYVDALHLILKVFSSYRTNSSLQVAGHTAMFYILPKVEMNRDTKKAVLCELLYAMENHMDEQEMVRKCCILLCLFEISQDFLLNYIRIAKQLVRVLVAHGSILSTQRDVLRILISITLHLDQNQKIHLGLIGIIEIILELIRTKLAADTSGIVMEMCWCVLANMTDETPANCERFLTAEGMQLSSLCFSRFRSITDQTFEVPAIDKEIVLNMIMLVGNIAEVKCLRNQLMDKDYLTIYTSFLYWDPNHTEGFEISYTSAYVLAYLVSEGEAAWRSVHISRRSVMETMVAVIGQWDLSTKIGFHYSSLKPIWKLLLMFGSPASVHWAVWALANLTSTYPEKYCRYVDEEGGEKLVQKLVYDIRVSAKISILARIVLANMDNWRNPGAITTSSILDEAIMSAEQNSNPYLKKMSRIMMRFLPVWLPVSTLVIASGLHSILYT